MDHNHYLHIHSIHPCACTNRIRDLHHESLPDLGFGGHDHFDGLTKGVEQLSILNIIHHVILWDVVAYLAIAVRDVHLRLARLSARWHFDGELHCTVPRIRVLTPEQDIIICFCPLDENGEPPN